MIKLNTPSAPDAAKEILQATSLDDFARKWAKVTRDVPPEFEGGFSAAVIDYLITTNKDLDDFLQSLPT